MKYTDWKQFMAAQMPAATPSQPPTLDLADITRRLTEIVGAEVTVRGVKRDGSTTVVDAVTSSAWPFNNFAGKLPAPGSQLSEQPAPLPQGVVVSVQNKYMNTMSLRGIGVLDAPPAERREISHEELCRRLQKRTLSSLILAGRGRPDDGADIVLQAASQATTYSVAHMVPECLTFIVVNEDGDTVQSLRRGTDTTVTYTIPPDLAVYQPPRYFVEDGDTAWSKQVPRWLTQAVQKVGAVSAYWRIGNSHGAKRLTFRFPWGVNAEAKQREIYDNSTISGKTAKIFVATTTECMPPPKVPLSLIRSIRASTDWASLLAEGDDRDVTIAWQKSPSWNLPGQQELLNTCRLVVRDIVAASPQLSDADVADRANCYADIVEEARRTNTESSEVAKTYCERWLNRFALLEVEETNWSVNSPPATLRLSKQPLSLDAIAKVREVLAKSSGTQEDAKKAAKLDGDLEVYFLTRWARGLSDGEAWNWWYALAQQDPLVKLCGRIAAVSVNITAFDAVAARTRPNPTLDVDPAADPVAAVAAWQRQQQIRRDQEARWKQRRIIEEVVATEPTRWDLLELDGAMPPPPTPMRPALSAALPKTSPTFKPPAPRHIDATVPPPCRHYVDASMLPSDVQAAVVFGAMVEAAQRRYDN